MNDDDLYFDEEKFRQQREIEKMRDKIEKMNNVIHNLVDLIMDSDNSDLMNKALRILVYYPRY